MELILSDDQLKHLEKRWGPSVRQIGVWNSDGVFAYISIPLATVNQAAEALNDASLLDAVSELHRAPDPNQRLLHILEMFGPVLVEKIIAIRRAVATWRTGAADRADGQVVEWELQ